MFGTLFIVIEHALLYFPVVLGTYLSVSLMKIPDLSLESAYVAGSIFGAQVLIFTNTWPLIPALMLCFSASLLGGLLAGFIASMLTQKARFPHLLSSIITMGIFHGLNQFFLGTSNVSLTQQRNLLASLKVNVADPESFGIFADFFAQLKRHPELPFLAILFIVTATAGHFFLKTEFGTSLAVYGNNPKFFEHYGIATSYVFINGLLLSNGLAGFAGFCDVQSSGFVDLSMGTMKALFCIISIILGKAIVRPKKPSTILVPIVGVFAYFAITQLLLKVHFNLKYYTMVQSIIVAFILMSRQQRVNARNNQLGV